jgi:hypothetical protein
LKQKSIYVIILAEDSYRNYPEDGRSKYLHNNNLHNHHCEPQISHNICPLKTVLNVKKIQYVLQHWGTRRFVFSQVSFTNYKKKLLTPNLFHSLSSESNTLEAFCHEFVHLHAVHQDPEVPGATEFQAFQIGHAALWLDAENSNST